MSAAGEGSSRGRGRGRGGAGGSSGGSRRAAFGGSITTADAGDSNPQAQSSTQESGGGRNSGGGGGGQRGGRRGGAAGGGGNSNNNNNSRRAGKQRAQNDASSTSAEAHATSAQRAAESHAASAAAAVVRADAEADKADPDTEYCFICAEPVVYYSVAPCDHRTCHVCAIRLRALYKKMECTFCKTASDRLIFSTSPTKSFGQFLPTDIPFSDAKLSISFETQEMYEQTLVLLRFNCPNSKCEVASTSWGDLKSHARRDHGRLLCDLCIRFKKIFAHEHELHTSQSLQAHMGKDHGRCDYCKEYFYSDDELYVHMRDNHEQCHICKARGGEAERWMYYHDYAMLETHFRDDHFLCVNRECLEKRFVVFESEMDFKAHQLAEHANELSARERREALRVDAHFTFEDASSSTPASVPGAPPGAGQAGGRRGGGRSERERERDADLPRAGGGGAASRRANFGGALTNGAPVDSSAGPAREDDAARESRIFQRAATILGSSSDSKIAALRSVTAAYRASECSARDFVLTVSSLVGSAIDVERTNALLQVLVGTGSGSGERGLFEEEEKRSDVLTSWNAVRMERTHFPSLSGSTQPSTSATPSGSLSDQLARTQIRSIKNTAAASSNRVWENVERAATGSSSGSGPGRYGLAASSAGSRAGLARNANNFPALGMRAAPPANLGSVNVPGSARHAAAASASVRTGMVARSGGSSWGTGGGSGNASGAGSSSTAASRPVVPVSVQVSNGAGSSSSSAARLPRSAFPSLPSNSGAAALAAQKKALLAKKGPASGGPVSPAASDSWGPPLGASISSGRGGANGSAGGSASNSLPGTPGLGEGPQLGGGGDASGAGGGGKKKKGKGVVLLSMGGVQRG
ncbi:hypothetical protein V8E36_005879 [Tilletia maclaganii]